MQISSIPSLAPLAGTTPTTPGPAASPASFAQTLSQALQTVNQSMEESTAADEAVISGQAENLHTSQIAGARADVLMKMTVSMSSKLAHCATTLMQMQL